MPTLAEWHVGQVFLTLLWFFLFFIFIWLLIVVFSDIFRSHDMNGWIKALWVIGIIIFPFLGVLVYLIAESHGMAERNQKQAQAAQSQFDDYVKTVAAQSDPTEQITKAKGLLDSGAITQAEFDSIKAKALAGS